MLTYSFLLAEKFDLDIIQIVEEKIKINNVKYPLEKSRGSAKKYTDL
ncbi:MAG: MazG-like family protein [Bacteroidales bacterium]|nr:MazG-like family protein [Bacteroidales bacterium]